MATPFGTHVELMSNVPLNPKYEHTLLFPNKTQQTAYFNSKVLQSASFTSLSYQRHSGGVIRVAAGMEILDEVNYLRFTNPYHENKAFYAFITDVKYVNENCVEISYAIDVIQTWMFDYTLNPCYIEREHAASDELGDNLVPESLETGDYVAQAIENLDKWDSSYTSGDIGYIQNSGFVVAATQAPDGHQAIIVTNGTPNVVYLTLCDDASELQTVINNYISGTTGNLDPIISINMYPKWSTPVGGARGQCLYKKFSLGLDWSVGVGPFIANDSVRGTTKSYSAKNKKLLTYPYNFIVFESPDGSSVELKYENFENIGNHIEFEAFLSLFPYVETAMSPISYESTRGYSTIGVSMNPKYMLTCKTYPTCGVSSDAFAAWWAQNKYSMPILDAAKEVVDSSNYQGYVKNTDDSSFWGKLEKGLIGAIETFDKLKSTGTGTLAAISSISKGVAASSGLSSTLLFGASSADSIKGQLAAYKGHQAVPATTACKANSSLIHGMELDCYKIYYTRIRPEYAEIIDNYFTCYGYAQHIVKTPNITSRRYWNYIQTKGCTISGNVPADAEDQIVAIYDKGITFWHDPSAIYNYSLNNDIV